MAGDSDKNENLEAYKATSNSLQSMVLIFLGFLLFISFTVFSYYFLAYDYKILNNIDFFSNETNRNVDAIRNTLKNYTSHDHHYIVNTDIINNATANYTKSLEFYYNNSKNMTAANDTQQIQSKTFPICASINSESTKTEFKRWKDCNVQLYNNNLRKNYTIIVDKLTTQKIRDKIRMAELSINNISANNNLSSSFLSDSQIIKVSEIEALRKSIKNLYPTNNTLLLTYEQLDTWPYLATLNAVPNDLQNKKVTFRSGLSEYEDKIQKSNFPIIGIVPFINIKGVFLSFPILIVIGFSFTSLQFKKLITFRKKLRHEEEKIKSVLSWADPLQPLPEQAFPLLMIVLPFILFLVCVIFINGLWYHNLAYTNDSGILTPDLLSLPQNIKGLLFILYVFSFIVMMYFYYQVLLAWIQYRKVKAKVIKSSSPKSWPTFKYYKGY